MAPNSRRRQEPTIYYYSIMPSPTSKVLVIMNHNSAKREPDSSFGHTKVVPIGKDQHPVTIQELVLIDSEAWKKRVCFDGLKEATYLLCESEYNFAEIFSFVDGEVPVDTGFAHQDATKVANDVSAAVFDVTNLQPMTCLDSTGKTVSLQDCNDLVKRKGDMCFIRLSCEIDAAVIDNCIDQAGKLSVTFCLHLPSHSYNSNDRSVADATPTKKQLPNPFK